MRLLQRGNKERTTEPTAANKTSSRSHALLIVNVKQTAKSRAQTKGAVKNEDLWKRLDSARARHEVDWRWVKGHAGHEFNEVADELARRGMLVTLGEA